MVNKLQSKARLQTQRTARSVDRRRAAPLDSETRKASRRGDRRYLIERGADNRKNDASRNESHSPSVQVAIKPLAQCFPKARSLVSRVEIWVDS